MSSQRHNERLLMGVAAVYSLTKAASLLPISDSIAREWLRKEGLVVNLEGKEVVCWADVKDALHAGRGPEEKSSTRRRRLPRVPLKPI